MVFRLNDSLGIVSPKLVSVTCSEAFKVEQHFKQHIFYLLQIDSFLSSLARMICPRAASITLQCCGSKCDLSSMTNGLVILPRQPTSRLNWCFEQKLLLGGKQIRSGDKITMQDRNQTARTQVCTTSIRGRLPINLALLGSLVIRIFWRCSDIGRSWARQEDKSNILKISLP